MGGRGEAKAPPAPRRPWIDAFQHATIYEVGHRLTIICYNLQSFQVPAEKHFRDEGILHKYHNKS